MADQNTEMLEELKKIRELLTPKPAAEGRKGFVGEFLDFVGKYKILGLAVAFVIGMYLGEVVKTLVSGLLMPLVEDILEPVLGGGGAGGIDLMGSYEFKPLFIALVTFLIVCLLVFIVMKLAKKFKIE
jgi:large conductance mechanosensitive channel